MAAVTVHAHEVSLPKIVTSNSKYSIDLSILPKTDITRIFCDLNQDTAHSSSFIQHYRLIGRLSSAIKHNLFYTIAIVKEVVRGVMFYHLFDMEELRNLDLSAPCFVNPHTQQAVKEISYFILPKSSEKVFKHLITLSLPASGIGLNAIKTFLAVNNNTDCRLDVIKSADSLYSWGEHHYNRFKVKCLPMDGNAEAAFMYFEKAAYMLHEKACIYLGSLYQHNIGVANSEENPKHAFRCYATANFLKKNTNALVSLGYCYEHGIGVQKHEETAIEYYQEAVAMDDPDALYNLGVCYEKGIGVSISPEQAFISYQKAAKLGHRGAWVNLGYCYERGFGVTSHENNPRYTFNCYQNAARLGDILGVYNLGYCYEHNIGVPKSEENIRYALYFYQKAFKHGDTSAGEDVRRLKQYLEIRKNSKKARKSPMCSSPSSAKYLCVSFDAIVI